MQLSSEQLLKLRALSSRIANEYDREQFNFLVAQLIAVFEEIDDEAPITKRPNQGVRPQVA